MFDLKWPIPIIDVQEVIKKTDPEFFYEQYKPMLQEYQNQNQPDQYHQSYRHATQNEFDNFQYLESMNNQVYYESQFRSIKLRNQHQFKSEHKTRQTMKQDNRQ